MLFYIYLKFSKHINQKWLNGLVLIFVVMINAQNIKYYILNPKDALQTEVGTLKLLKTDKILFEKVNDFIIKNIKKDENFIVVPEGQIFNLVHKKSWRFYNSTFTPLDFETFKEENIIKKLNQNKTEYIIFYPRNTRDYGKETICYDYGVDFCTYIMDNYSRVATIEEKYKALIFKLKE